MDDAHDDTFEIISEPYAAGIIASHVASSARQHVDSTAYRSYGLVLQTANRAMAGGAAGELQWDWLHVTQLWVREDIRGRGFGSRLLARLEQTAWQHGARHVYLETYSFEAPGFYRKNGYQVFGMLPEFPAGHQRFFMTKTLEREAIVQAIIAERKKRTGRAERRGNGK